MCDFPSVQGGRCIKSRGFWKYIQSKNASVLICFVSFSKTCATEMTAHSSKKQQWRCMNVMQTIGKMEKVKWVFTVWLQNPQSRKSPDRRNKHYNLQQMTLTEIKAEKAESQKTQTHSKSFFITRAAIFQWLFCTVAFIYPQNKVHSALHMSVF